MRTLLLFLPALMMADGPGKIESRHVAADFQLTGSADTGRYKNSATAQAVNNPVGKPSEGHETDIRSVWSNKYLYFHFTCRYRELHLKPSPSVTTETNKLWEFDVAEVFIGADFNNIRQYREYQVSPQGEYVDLYIDRDKPWPEGGWKWNAEGFAVKASIDQDKKIWYGEMRVPIASITDRKPDAGQEFRANFYRLQGPPPDRAYVSWQPTGAMNYHIPESFGRLVLTK